MKLTSNNKLLPIIGLVVGISSALAGLSTTAASAATVTSTVASSQPSVAIARSIVHMDKIQAMAGALDVSASQVQAHLKAHGLKQLVADKGLTETTFRQEVLTRLHSQLQAQGYSQTQIDSVLQHHQKHSRSN